MMLMILQCLSVKSPGLYSCRFRGCAVAFLCACVTLQGFDCQIHKFAWLGSVQNKQNKTFFKRYFGKAQGFNKPAEKQN